MSSIREQIFANRLTALQAALLYDDAHPSNLCKVVDRLNASFFDPVQFPALYLYPAKETKNRKNLIYECSVEAVIHVTAEIGNDVADTLLNSIHTAVEVVMLSDQSCGKLAQSCFETSVVFGIEQGGTPRAVILSTWKIDYQHAAKDPTKSS